MKFLNKGKIKRLMSEETVQWKVGYKLIPVSFCHLTLITRIILAAAFGEKREVTVKKTHSITFQ
jgi:hypothetical protein